MEITALIVDEEPIFREHLRRMLEAQGVIVMASGEGAAGTVRLAERTCPDVVFADVCPPDLPGSALADALSRLASPPLLVFLADCGDYAAGAYNVGAIDYLIKPVTPERLSRTVDRVRANREHCVHTLDAAASSLSTARRLPIRDDYSIKLVRFDEIAIAEAREKRVCISTAKAEYRTYDTLKQLETVLPRRMFCRVHESYIVNVEMVEELIFLGSHSYEVRLTNNRRVPVSRSRYPQLQRRLGLD